MLMDRDDPRFIEEVNALLFDYLDEDGRPWWFNIRDVVLQEVNRQLKGFFRPQHGIRSFSSAALRYCSVSALGMMRSMRKTKSCDYLLQVPARYDMSIRTGAAYNIFSDGLFPLMPTESVLFERAPTNWACPNNRVIKDSIPAGIIDISAHIYSAAVDRVKKVPKSLVELSAELIKSIGCLYGSRIDLSLIYDAIHIAYRRYLAASFAGERIMSAISDKTKLILLVGGIYAENSHYIYSARKRGIIVAELQHGAFDSQNVICSPAASVCSDSRFAASKPDYWLFYGDWWASQTMMPSKKVVLGNPYREMKRSRLVGGLKRDVLLVGDSKNTEHRMRMAKQLKQLFPQYRVLFRPHPIELNEAEYLSRSYPDVSIDNGDLYETLQRCVFVLGPYSTVLFEAMGIAEQVMLYVEQPVESSPQVPFPIFHTIEELSSLISGGVASQGYPPDIWHADWKSAFKSFISSVVNVKEDPCQ